MCRLCVFYSLKFPLLLKMICFQNRCIPVPIAALLVSQITSAIKYLHQCKIIHGDLKPDNVILKSL